MFGLPSRTRVILSIFATAALLLALVVSSDRLTGVHAATPASGSIDTSGTSVQWDFAPVVAGTVTDVGGAKVCPPGMCDNYDLTVVLPTSDPTTYYQSNTVKLVIKYTWTSTVPTDLDIFAFSPSGAQHGPGSPDDASTGAGEEDLVITDPAPGVWNVRSMAAIAATPTPAHAVATMTATTGSTPTVSSTNGPTFTNYAAPAPIGQRSGEPSVGADWATGDVMYTGAGCATCNPFSARIHFDTSTKPATATWTDVSPLLTSHVTADPIGFMDHSGPSTDRWFMSELDAACSLTAFTDNDGTTWTPSQGCGTPAGADHQTIGGGPYAPNTAAHPLTSYQDAVYYCSQDIAAAFCARSDDGGLTFGAGVPIYSLTQCGGLHGHVKVAFNGIVYVPNKSCGGKPGLVVSTDNGTTWTVNNIPDGASVSQGSDPSVGIGSKGTVYFGYQSNVNGDRHAMIAVSHDHGQTWNPSIDVGAALGIQNIEFPAVVAGDDNRAAYAFLGTPTTGDDQASDFPGVWHMYVAYTSDGGYTWTTVDATPSNPVQRGCIWDGGGSNTCRNMADFNDAQIDNAGRVYIAYTDGCTGPCETDPNAPTASSSTNYLGRYSRIASLLRQDSGQLLYSGVKHK